MTTAARASFIFVAAQVLFSQPVPGLDKLRPGIFLVAARELSDPNFAETVVLVHRYDRTGAMGLIVNRRLDELPLTRVFPSLPASSRRGWEGGPVSRSGALALVRSTAKPDETAELVVGDVYLLNSRSALERALEKGPAEATLRVYLGYAGWGPRQLDGEVALGGWHIFPATVGEVFDAAPGTLWKRLIRRTELSIARALRAR